MYRGDNGNNVIPVFLDESQFQYDTTNASKQLQLFGNLQASCGVDPVKYVQNDHVTALRPPNKRCSESEDISRQQKLQISLNSNFYQEDVDHSAFNFNPNPTPVSTGLRLSNDDDEHNSCMTSTSANVAAGLPVIFSLGNDLKTEISGQNEELDHYIRIQENHITKGVREMTQRHLASFLSTIEMGVGKKLREKDIEIENINHKNRELVERIKQVATEAQSWQYRAKYNESMVNVLKNNLRLAIAQGADRVKEGYGDSEVDDAASSILDQNNPLRTRGGSGYPANANYQGLKDQMTCRACKLKEVSILLLPCRHLCLCSNCDGLVDACPVCQSNKTATFQVYMS
ncbi:hypothetical protein IFM89_038775 [Coptis chinensis]|uniref:RING-type domain-containing protein n=1 Tax=Coptis chinensis TaxID=261450 RepID=A0A835MBN8_9MAGN|nr:hypothetical protein IFM89_038775 [Coptis chinensis]